MDKMAYVLSVFVIGLCLLSVLLLITTIVRARSEASFAFIVIIVFSVVTATLYSSVAWLIM